MHSTKKHSEPRCFKAKHRIGVRGNIFSFIMPWHDILSQLLDVMGHAKLSLPHPPEVIAHLVRLHLKVDNLELTRHMKEVCVRTHVVVELGHDLIRHKHPALMKKTNAGQVELPSTAEIMAKYTELVHKYYPPPSDPSEAEHGVAPAAVLEVIEQGRQARATKSPLHEKNATPPPGATCPENVFDSVQPQAVVLERSTLAGSDVSENMKAALQHYGAPELRVQTGNTFLPTFFRGLFPNAVFVSIHQHDCDCWNIKVSS